jgi:hypothetical protein
MYFFVTYITYGSECLICVEVRLGGTGSLQALTHSLPPYMVNSGRSHSAPCLLYLQALGPAPCFWINPLLPELGINVLPIYLMLGSRPLLWDQPPAS